MWHCEFSNTIKARQWTYYKLRRIRLPAHWYAYKRHCATFTGESFDHLSRRNPAFQGWIMARRMSNANHFFTYPNGKDVVVAAVAVSPELVNMRLTAGGMRARRDPDWMSSIAVIVFCGYWSSTTGIFGHGPMYNLHVADGHPRMRLLSKYGTFSRKRSPDGDCHRRSCLNSWPESGYHVGNGTNEWQNMDVTLCSTP